MNKLMIATGTYINAYNRETGEDVFVIVNEANDVTTEKIYEAQEILEDEGLHTMELKEEKLELVFEYGVQIITKQVPEWAR